MPEPTVDDIREIWDCHLDGCSVSFIRQYKVEGLSRGAIAKVISGDVPEYFRNDPRLDPHRFIWISVSGKCPLPDGSDAPFIFLKLPRKLTEANFRKGITHLKKALASDKPEASIGLAMEAIETGIVLKFMRDSGYSGWELSPDLTVTRLPISGIESKPDDQPGYAP